MKTSKIITATLFIAASIAGMQVQASAETVAAAPQVERAEYPDMPKGHWSYEVVQCLSAPVYWDRPHTRPYSGFQSMTRYEFAVAIARMLNKIGSDLEKIPPPVLNQFQLPAPDVTRLEIIDMFSALCMEYEVELGRLGVNTSQNQKWFSNKSTPLYQLTAPK